MKILNKSRLLLAIGLFLVDAGYVLSQAAIEFADRSSQAGFVAPHFDGGGTKDYLPQLVMAGLAVFDFDNDGWLDVYLLNGREIFGSEGGDASKATGNTLYRNNQNGTFTDVTAKAGVAGGRFSLGVVAADYDNDGDSDLAVSNFGLAQLYLNNGDGTFASVEQQAGVEGSADQCGAGIAFLDIDNDGNLDLFASNYIEFSLAPYSPEIRRPTLYAPGPNDFAPAADRLYRSLGNGLFEDVSISSGIAALPGPSMGVVCADFDGDNDADIFVSSDASANQLFVNEGAGSFTDGALEAGVAYDLNGLSNGCMGVEAGDYDNDGWVDLLITDFTGQTPMLFRNLQGGFFQDTSRVTQVGRTVMPHTNWGVGMVDFDNDADLDVFFANGHLTKNIETIDDRTRYRVANTLMQNEGKKGFRDVSSTGGSGMKIVECSRGSAFGDLDRDGDIDVVVLNANSTPSYLENQTKSLGGWVDIRLVGTIVNRDAVGASVRVISSVGAQQLSQVAIVHAGRSYQSHYGTELHFGLRDAARVEKIDVTWPGGAKETFAGCPATARLVLVQGMGESVLK
jgi:hypothetical protein